MSFIVRCLTIAAVLASAFGCAVNPVTGKQEFSLVSGEQEVAIGNQHYAPSQQAQGGRYYLDPEIQVYVAEIGRKLAAVSDRKDLPYEFVVLNNPVPNAWALPGGKIAINRGLLTHLEDEAQLAAVLAHEIVHAAARHSAAQMSRGTLIGLGAAAVDLVSQQSGLGQLGGMAGQVGAAAWMAQYGRGAELESDAYGMEYMVRAGYDPQGAVKLQQTFVKLSEGRQPDFLSGLFASHPPSQERVSANQLKAQSYPPGGATNRDRYQQKISRITRDKAAYDAQGKALKALKNKDAKTALSLLDQAIKLQPREGQFYELRGHAWRMLENTANADRDFSTAIEKNPDYFSHHLARGIARYENNKQPSARTDLERSYALLPTPIASLYLGDIAADAGNQQQAIEYYQQAAQDKGEVGKQAQGKLATLEMASAPHKYIASQVFVNNDGYLYVAIRNNSTVTVTDITVELTEMLNAFMVGSSAQLRGPRSLTAGQQATMRTGIGPFGDSGAAHRYRARVIAAKPQ